MKVVFVLSLDFGWFNNECEWFIRTTDELKAKIDELMANHIYDFSVSVHQEL